MVWAYDDLQTIFQASTPTLGEIVGIDKDGNPLINLASDTVLYKCYRNPREILVVAHALGFGIYGSRMVQMLLKSEDWENIGYEVQEGDFVAGSEMVIERPQQNSLGTISSIYAPNEIIQVAPYETYTDEIVNTANSIKKDIADGLRPDDILVTVVDDLNAKTYLNDLQNALASMNIMANNVHADSFGLRDFQTDGQVTLSTVHKAKGNEAFMVYVVGIDNLFSSYAGVKERNILFTAITRAKGWVRLSGVKPNMNECVKEVKTALKNFPYLMFNFPGPEQLKRIKMDLEEKALKKQRLERMLDEILQNLSPDEVKSFVEQRSIYKRQHHGRSKKK